MKKLYISLLLAIGIVNLSLAQIKTTGVVTIPGTLYPMAIQLDMDKGTNLLTLTVSGPADRLFCIGFNSEEMDGTPDTVTFTKDGAYTQLAGGTAEAPVPYIPAGENVILDTKGFTGTQAISLDTGSDDWTKVSDVNNLGIRTVVATRRLDTGNTTEDYKFDFDNLSSLNLIWAMWRNATLPDSDHPDDGMWALSGRNTIGGSTRHNSGDTQTRGSIGVTFTQTEAKSTGVVTLTPEGAAKPMTLKLDMDKTMGLIYMTVTGPADRMFYIGFGGTNMETTPDGVAITKLGACDQLAGTLADATKNPPVVQVTQPYIAPAGNAVLDIRGFIAAPPPPSPVQEAAHYSTYKDVVNDWTVISDDGDYPPTKATRTVIASRALNTNSTEEGDIVFDYDNLTSLNIIWAEGRDFVGTTDFPTNPDSPDNGYWALSGKNTVGITTRHGGSSTGQRGATTMSFAALGVADKAYSENITIYPNPGKGTYNILTNNSLSISRVRIFDINAKLLKEIPTDTLNNNLTIDISHLTRGIYFMEISNEHDRTVKKIIKE